MRNRQARELRRRDLTWIERVQYAESIMGAFHMKMCAAINIIKNFYGPPNTEAPESLWTHIKLLGRKFLALDKSQPFKPTLEILKLSLFARVLDGWRVLAGVKDLKDYGKKKPTFEDVWEMGAKFVKTFASSLKLEAERQKTPKQRDEVWENSSLFIRDTLILLAFCAAVKAGDTGCMRLIHRFWLFSFWGAGSFNYGLESFFLEQNLRFEWTPAMCDAFLDNWLMNTKGRKNCWVEVDLVQEHQNFWIKVRSDSIRLLIIHAERVPGYLWGIGTERVV